MGRFSYDDDFRKRMRPHAEAIYKHVFPGCRVHDLRSEKDEVHDLDKHFGIDTMLKLESGTKMSVQEKYRRYEFLDPDGIRYDYCSPDFTQEIRNAVGTEHERPGEWSHLNADLYFYGWATPEEDSFAAWALIIVPVYKTIVEYRGGLGSFSSKEVNRKHGKAGFYAFPIMMLESAFLESDIPDEYLPGYPENRYWNPNPLGLGGL